MSAESARTNNVKEHVKNVHNLERPFLCPMSGCKKAGAGYCRKYDLQRHLKAKHSVLVAATMEVE